MKRRTNFPKALSWCVKTLFWWQGRVNTLRLLAKLPKHSKKLLWAWKRRERYAWSTAKKLQTVLRRKTSGSEAATSFHLMLNFLSYFASILRSSSLPYDCCSFVAICSVALRYFMLIYVAKVNGFEGRSLPLIVPFWLTLRPFSSAHHVLLATTTFLPSKRAYNEALHLFPFEQASVSLATIGEVLHFLPSFTISPFGSPLPRLGNASAANVNAGTGSARQLRCKSCTQEA